MLLALLVPLTPASATPLFSDGFESSTASVWTTNVGGAGPESTKYAHLITTGASEYLEEAILAQSNLYVDVKVDRRPVRAA